jgi:lipoprotein-anchoring transpeptidase ErfK/SrfK
VWLPYWQSFNADIGFHQTTSYLHEASLGSHGCVNLLPADAVAYWDTLEDGSNVRVFGHRVGT